MQTTAASADHSAPQPATVQAQEPMSNVALAAPTACGSELMVRVGRVLQEISAARGLSDAEILQHCLDCARLMEAAYQRFEDHGNPADRDEAVLWSDRRAQAQKALSPVWKAAREAQIQQAIAKGTGCFFSDQADRDRAARRAAGA